MEVWKNSRAGIVNFWYYDDEEFIFEDGRLLLRGANGSGKSVTMQSLVPLLYDGNIRPERLDPFGSKARKMESYLLSDGLDREERTAYLFLEFEKKEAHRFMSIGMGMRARKNKPLQSWYFIIHDNRRLGADKDLCLYKNVGERIPLTQKELENRIGEGGYVYTKQSDYKKAVNEYLFGYKDLTDFEELITLLIQIRSPKLSKEFKPTTMYEIMQNSLITLTEEDLRPMSEAIENMDEVKLKIDALQNAEQAMKRIDNAYTKYNTYMLANKARRYVDYTKELNFRKQNKIEKEFLYNENIGRVTELSDEIQTLLEENEQLKKKESRLKEHDLTQLATEKISLEKASEEVEKVLNKKRMRLAEFEERERDNGYAQKEKKQTLESTEYKIENQLDELGSEIEATGFDEHKFFESEYKRQTDKAYDFGYHEESTRRYQKKVSTGLVKLKEVESLEKEHDKVMQKRETMLKKQDDQEQVIREHERQLHEVQSEFAEQSFAWWNHLKILRLDENALKIGVERVYQYGETYRYVDILEPVSKAYDSFREVVLREKSKLRGYQDQLRENLESEELELSLLLKKKEPEPERPLSVIKNRERLIEAGIPFVPLYKALDFHKDLSEEIKGILEEAFLDLGILDALIVSPDYQEKVLKMDVGLADKYIFANPHLLSHNLTTYLSVDSTESEISARLIDDVLQSIFVYASEDGFFIEESGHYGFGIIHGKVSGESESRFIGYQSRKRYKNQLIEEKQVVIKAIKVAINKGDEEVALLDKKLLEAECEWKAFPTADNLEVAYNDYITEKNDLKRIIREVESLTSEAEELYKKLNDSRYKLHELTVGIQLKEDSQLFQDALEILEDYRNRLYELKDLDRQKWYTKASLEKLEEDFLRIQEDVDEIRTDCSRAERTLTENRQRIGHIEEELSLHDYDAIFKELLLCQKRLEEIPRIREKKIQECANMAADNKVLLEKISECNTQISNQEKRVKLYAWAFESELSLGYVTSFSEEESTLKLAKKVLVGYGSFLEDSDSVMVLQEKLNEKFHQESGELVDYHLKSRRLFKEKPFEEVNEEDSNMIERFDITSRLKGKDATFYDMLEWMQEQMLEYNQVLDQKDRELFEEILINSVSRKISAKIFHSEKWVKKIDQLMSNMDTSMGLKFNLRWVTKNASAENQLSTKELVDILKGEQSLLTQEKKEQLINHFKSKIQEIRNRLGSPETSKSFLGIMKEVLDYRQWFEFQLSYTRPGERKREMTDNAFFTFSGGEKAMAMYVPLFSAVYAKYQGANTDCPKLVSLDEAFAGVDEKNIQDMFKLLVELDLGFIANSQVLFGDYETVPALSIYELIRPENVTFVTLIRYLWNGQQRDLVVN